MFSLLIPTKKALGYVLSAVLIEPSELSKQNREIKVMVKTKWPRKEGAGSGEFGRVSCSMKKVNTCLYAYMPLAVYVLFLSCPYYNFLL